MASVDYRELNVISYIKEGDLLAKLFPEDRGIKGYDVQEGKLNQNRYAPSVRIWK